MEWISGWERAGMVSPFHFIVGLLPSLKGSAKLGVLAGNAVGWLLSSPPRLVSDCRRLCLCVAVGLERVKLRNLSSES